MDSAFQINKVKESRRDRIQAFVLSKEGKLILLFMLVAFLFRLFLIRYQYVINSDGVYFAILGKRLISGDIAGGMSAYWPPLYPFLIGVSSLFFNDLEFAGRFVSVVAGTLLVIPAYLLICEFHGRRPALLGAFLVVIYPSLTEFSTLLMAESTYTLFFIVGVLVCWRALKDLRSRNFFLTGLLFGACYLLKPEAIGYIGLLLVLTLCAKFFHKHLQLKTVAQNALLLLLGFLILSAPYLIYLRQVTGRWTISQKLLINAVITDSGKHLLNLTDDKETTMWDKIYGDVYQRETIQTTVSSTVPSASPASESSAAPSPSPGVISRLKGKLVNSLKLFKLQIKQYILQIFPYLFIFFSIVGLFRRSWTKERTVKETYLFLFVISTLIGYAVTVAEVRYLVPLLPILLCWATKGVVEFESWIVRSASRLGISLYAKRGLIRVAIVAVLILSITPSIIYPMRAGKWDNLPFEHKQLGLWIKERSGPSSVVMANGPWSAYYAGATHIYIPISEDYPTIIDYARRKKVDYFVIETRCLDNTSCMKDTSLAFLLDERQAPPELKLVYKNDEMLGYKILAYELTDRSATH